nr:1-phosphatidylinositol-3-phosphate 5-kinase [Ipomoea batatas]
MDTASLCVDSTFLLLSLPSPPLSMALFLVMAMRFAGGGSSSHQSLLFSISFLPSATVDCDWPALLDDGDGGFCAIYILAIGEGMVRMELRRSAAPFHLTNAEMDSLDHYGDPPNQPNGETHLPLDEEDLRTDWITQEAVVWTWSLKVSIRSDLVREYWTQAKGSNWSKLGSIPNTVKERMALVVLDVSQLTCRSPIRVFDVSLLVLFVGIGVDSEWVILTGYLEWWRSGLLKSWISWRSEPANVSRDFWMPDESCRHQQQTGSPYGQADHRNDVELHSSFPPFLIRGELGGSRGGVDRRPAASPVYPSTRLTEQGAATTSSRLSRRSPRQHGESDVASDDGWRSERRWELFAAADGSGPSSPIPCSASFPLRNGIFHSSSQNSLPLFSDQREPTDTADDCGALHVPSSM